MVGALYPQGDHRRDGAFTLFYMGINLGAFLGPLVSGQLAEDRDWSYGFASAAVGMVIGLTTFLFTQRLLGRAGLPPRQDATGESRLTSRDWIEIAAIAAGLVLTVYGAIEAWPYVRWLWSPSWMTSTAVAFAYKGGILLAILGGFLWLTEPKFKQEEAELHEPFTGVDWQRLAVILSIGLFSIVFWMGFEQSGGTLNLFADEKTDHTVLGYTLKTAWFQSINPVFIISLAPVFAALWTALAKRNVSLPSVAKQGLGLIILSLAFAVMYFADKQSKQGALVSPLWLVAVYFLFTVAELFVSPIGLSLVTKLAHPRIVSLMMAYWFVCTAAANYLAGIMERTIEPWDLNLWAFLGAMAFVPGVMMLALTPVLVKMSHGRV
jgi:POT family proton-dependent oligopeptide transporter